MTHRLEFVHLSDSHLGKRQYGLDQRLKDWGNATNQAIKYAIRAGVDLVIHSGDLLEHNKPDPDTFAQVLKILDPLRKKGIPFIVTEGNHDKRRGRQEKTLMDILETLGYCVFLTASKKDISASTYKKNGYRLVGLGYPGMNLKKWIDDYKKSLPNDGRNIILLHAGIEGYIRGGLLIPFKDLKKLKDKSVYLALGHGHDHFQKDNWAFNPGSVEREKIDKREKDKLFYHVKIKDRKVDAKPVKIQTRKMFYIDIKADNDWEEIIKKLKEKVKDKDLDGALVKIAVYGKLESEFKKWGLENIVEGNPLLLRIFDETFSEERESEWGGMESSEIERDILANHFKDITDNPEEVARFAREILKRILRNPPTDPKDAEHLAENIAKWRKENL